MPPSVSEFPSEMQVAFFIHEKLADRWEGMSGYYLGKNLGNIDTLFDIYNIEDKRAVLDLIMLYDNLIVKHRADKRKQEQEKEEQRNKGKEGSQAGPGKKMVHNIKGR